MQVNIEKQKNTPNGDKYETDKFVLSETQRFFTEYKMHKRESQVLKRS